MATYLHMNSRQIVVIENPDAFERSEFCVIGVRSLAAATALNDNFNSGEVLQFSMIKANCCKKVI